MTGGGVDEFDGNRYTFGGQAGAPTGAQPKPFGEWTHHQQKGVDGSFIFHAGTSSSPDETEIDEIVCSDPGFCDPARHAPAKQIDFAGVGQFKNLKDASDALAEVVEKETFHWFEVHIEDLGEPGKSGKQDPPADDCPPEGSQGTTADCDCPDFYRITIFAPFNPDSELPDRTNIIYQVYGYLDGGNLQIHPGKDSDMDPPPVNKKPIVGAKNRRWQSVN